MPKQIERICKNCRLFNPQKSECSVIIFVAGEKMRIPVDAADPCFFEENYFDPNENFAEHIKEIKIWSENEKGEKIDGPGTIKIEYDPNSFTKAPGA